jgi:hypothetical protein
MGFKNSGLGCRDAIVMIGYFILITGLCLFVFLGQFFVKSFGG